MAEQTVKASKSALAQFIGQDTVQAYLNSVLQQEQVSHAYLFLGPRGVGKSPASKAFAQALLCPRHGCGHCETCQAVLEDRHPDYLLWTEDKFSVDNVREIIPWVEAGPAQASRRVVILPLDIVNPIAQNALLKTLEEPNANVVFILLATSTAQVLPTIQSRSVVLRFHPLSLAENTKILLTQGFSENDAWQAALASGGSYEIAESILQEKEDFARLAVSFFSTTPSSKIVAQLLAYSDGNKQRAIVACERLAHYCLTWLAHLVQARQHQDEFLHEVVTRAQLLATLSALQKTILALQTTTNQELVFNALLAEVKAASS